VGETVQRDHAQEASLRARMRRSWAGVTLRPILLIQNMAMFAVPGPQCIGRQYEAGHDDSL